MRLSSRHEARAGGMRLARAAGSGTRKAQIWSTDLISGITLMSVMILLFVFEWNYLALRWNASSDYRELLGRAVFASDALLTAPGDPAGWERSGDLAADVRALGLAGTRNVLEEGKLARLMGLNESREDYEFVLSRLGLAGYQLHLTVSDMYDGTVYYDYGRPAGLNSSAVVDRLALINGTTVARTRVEVWK